MKVRIYKAHTHAGVEYTPGPEGIEIDVAEHDAAFLKAAGVLDKPEPVKPGKPDAVSFADK
jgi:hypothetical protein